ncbi:MAG: NapC/NirT family cytochrome c [Acidobacteria bacterium]|nr:NapC/NirT family cytochrome c [Acidobacteriota bacterium]
MVGEGNFRGQIGVWLRPLVFLGHNAITLIGAVITTSAGLTLLAFWAFEILKGGPIHPYAGIVFFLILPGIFFFGLALIPLGVYIRRRKLRSMGTLPAIYPRIDLHNPILRRGFVLVGIATVLNVIILGIASYQGVEQMDSVQFCGQTCHTVMGPVFAAYQDSPHSRVACVECHIGPGASWFVRSKLSGVRQVFAVTFKTYSRPIPTPVKELRPARETCEQCHWPQKFEGDKLVVRTKYQPDEANTPTKTVLVMKIGGHTAQGNVGIHGRHLDTVERISYTSTDDRRQVIPRVTYLDDDGKTIEFNSAELISNSAQLAAGEHRKMDCVDCHNTPTHAFQLPERAVDQAITDRHISPQLPYIKKKAVELLRADYPDRGTATQQIARGITEFYRTTYPDTYRDHRALIESAAQTVQKIYLRNVFPEMKVTWGTYINNIGHEDFLGCFRCHDGNHTSADGRTITQDCNACHSVLAMEETNPEVLTQLGLQ